MIYSTSLHCLTVYSKCHVLYLAVLVIRVAIVINSRVTVLGRREVLLVFHLDAIAI